MQIAVAKGTGAHRTQEAVPIAICQALTCALFVLTWNCRAGSLRLFVGSTTCAIHNQFSVGAAGSDTRAFGPATKNA